MKKLVQWLTNPPVDGPDSTIILRLIAGGVFLWEGILKFVYENQGVGRFTKLGMPLRTLPPASSPAWRSSAGCCCFPAC
jgi:hypothetical protein